MTARILHIRTLRRSRVWQPSRSFTPSPRLARRHRNLLLDARFTDPVAEVHTIVLTDDTALALLHRFTDDQSWLAEQAERARTNRIFVAVPMFLVAAQR